MNAGKLRHVVTVNQKVKNPIPGDRGQPVITWQQLAVCNASIENIPPYGKKAEIARQLVASATHIIEMRYLAGLDEKCQIVWNGRVFNIGYIWNHEERNIFVTILATEQKTGLIS